MHFKAVSQNSDEILLQIFHISSHLLHLAADDRLINWLHAIITNKIHVNSMANNAQWNKKNEHYRVGGFV